MHGQSQREAMTSAPSAAAMPGHARSWRGSVAGGTRIAVARLRFFLLLGAVLLVLGYWPLLRNVWDNLTGPAARNAGVSGDTEYWCPMCPGVLSDWPGKCPVCHMSLIQRQKGEMTPLPDGVVARMQFSPYRVQLAGIHTSPVAFRPLVREVILAGLIDPAGAKSDEVYLTTDVFEADAGLFKVGQKIAVTSDAFPGQSFYAQVTWLAPEIAPVTRSLAVKLNIGNPRAELRPGMFVKGRARVPLADLEKCREHVINSLRDRLLLASLVSTTGAACGTVPVSGLDTLLESAVEHAALHRGLVLSIPESAMIDTGTRKVVFVEQEPGVFEAYEVHVGHRAGEFVPVLSGLRVNQSVVTAGAFLLDAETKLNPAAAASYFGAGSRGGAGSITPTAPTSGELSAEDQRLVKRQKICPVTEEPLGSMGTPYRVGINGRTVFLCCVHCLPTLKADPAKYLANLPK